jgi:hypothetical protein
MSEEAIAETEASAPTPSTGLTSGDTDNAQSGNGLGVGLDRDHSRDGHGHQHTEFSGPSSDHGVRHTFFADDKFVAVIEYLEGIGWERSQDPNDCELLFTNLVSAPYVSIMNVK